MSADPKVDASPISSMLAGLLRPRSPRGRGGRTGEASPATASVRALLIDDDPGEAERTRRALRETGVPYELRHVRGLAAAELACAGEPYDVILLDLDLAESSCSVVVGQTRRMAPETPIVALTRCTAEQTLREALGADADDILPMADVDAVSLERAIRHARQRRELSLQVQAQQEEIRTAADRLENVVAAVSDGIAVLDGENEVLFANAAFAEMMGSDPEHIVGSRHACIPREDVSLIDVAGEGGRGTRRVEVASVPIVWDGHDARVATLRDVTARRDVEERLEATQRMDAVAHLAGGMAHEVNNVLAVVLANVALLKGRLHDREAVDLAEDIERVARRGTSLLKHLLAVGRRQRLHVGTIDLGAVVRDLGETLRALLPLHLDLRIHAPREPAPARADVAAIEQILLNLLNNARDATPGGGLLDIVVERTEVTDDLVDRHREMTQGPYVRLTVRDNGIGMEADTMSMAFEPFFTTKPRDAGTGLGLSTVYGLTRQLGGFVDLASERGEGTTVSLYFPLVADQDVADASNTPEGPPLAGGETILVVEDEEPLRRATARVLERLGYRVVEAANGQEALDVLRERSGEVDLVLSDVVMPVMGGHGLYRAMQEEVTERPPVLFVSGYSAEDLRDGDLLDPSFDLLEKPWGIPELQDGIRRALVAGATPPDGELVGGRRY